MSSITVDLSPEAQDWLRQSALWALLHIDIVGGEIWVLERGYDADGEATVRAALARVAGLGDLLDQMGYGLDPRAMSVTASSELLDALAREALRMVDDEVRGDIVDDRVPRSGDRMRYFADCVTGLEGLLVNATVAA